MIPYEKITEKTRIFVILWFFMIFVIFVIFVIFMISNENLKLQTVEHVPKDTPPQNHDLATRRKCESDGADGKIEQK